MQSIHAHQWREPGYLFYSRTIFCQSIIGEKSVADRRLHQPDGYCHLWEQQYQKCFDIALYDIASQNTGVPLYKFLGGDNNKTIITDYTVSIGEPDKMAADAVKINSRATRP